MSRLLNGAALLGAALALAWRPLHAPLTAAPAALRLRSFLRLPPSARQKPVVVCAGDSLTHGSVSANYVDLLQQRFPHYMFVNAGENGYLAYNVLQRVEDIVACQPAVVTLLVGTNDVNATFSPAWAAAYRREQKLPQLPELEWSYAQLQLLLERLQSATSARLVVLTLPMLGEDLDSVMNARIRDFNEHVRSLATGLAIPWLPLYATLVAALPAPHAPPPYAGKRGMMLRAFLRHTFLRQSWDAIARRNGLALLTDHAHLSDRGAALIAQLIGDFLSAPAAE